MNPLRWYFAALLTITLVLIVTGQAFAESATIDEKKEVLRKQYTETCASIKRPPPALLQHAKEAAERLPAAKPAAEWLFELDAYLAARCGHA